MLAIAFSCSLSSSESKDELKLKTFKFEVCLFPDNNANDMTLKHSMLKFSGTSGDPEDYLEFCRDLDDLFNHVNLQNSGSKFAHARAVLTGDALVLFNDFAVNAPVTNQLFQGRLNALRDEYLIAGTAEATKQALREATKGILTVTMFISHLTQVSSYPPFMLSLNNQASTQDKLRSIFI